MYINYRCQCPVLPAVCISLLRFSFGNDLLYCVEWDVNWWWRWWCMLRVN